MSFTVTAGGIYGLLGRNGAGKTTLMQLLTGQDFATSGTIRVFGENPVENASVLQRVSFIKESQTYPDDFKVKHVLRSAPWFHPHWDADFANSLVADFRLPVDRKIKKLSRGQLSAVGVIIGLASRAEVTFFDEPYLGLDVQNRDLFYRELVAAQEANPRTIVIASHDLKASAKLVDCYLVLRDGVIRTLESERLDDALVSLTVANPVPPELVRAALATESLGSSTRVVVRRGVADGSPVALEDAVALAMGGSDV